MATSTPLQTASAHEWAKAFCEATQNKQQIYWTESGLKVAKAAKNKGWKVVEMLAAVEQVALQTFSLYDKTKVLEALELLKGRVKPLTSDGQFIDLAFDLVKNKDPQHAEVAAILEKHFAAPDIFKLFSLAFQDIEITSCTRIPGPAKIFEIQFRTEIAKKIPGIVKVSLQKAVRFVVSEDGLSIRLDNDSLSIWALLLGKITHPVVHWEKINEEKSGISLEYIDKAGKPQKTAAREIDSCLEHLVKYKAIFKPV